MIASVVTRFSVLACLLPFLSGPAPSHAGQTAAPARVASPAQAPAPARAVPAPAPSATPSAAPVYTYTIQASYPHDPLAFTEGLVYHQGRLLESTGLNGMSSLREVELETGRVIRKQRLPARYFAEGLALWNDELIQLTYTTEVAFRYDLDTFQQLGQLDYQGEGWGLTHDGQYLIMSNGSSTLSFRDPVSFEEVGSVEVTDAGSPVRNLNELEYIQGKIWANIWYSNKLAIIEPSTGQVDAYVDLTGLLDPDTAVPWTDVLNGIAYDEAGDRLLVTGKFWTRLFHIDVVKP